MNITRPLIVAFVWFASVALLEAGMCSQFRSVATGVQQNNFNFAVSSTTPKSSATSASNQGNGSLLRRFSYLQFVNVKSGNIKQRQMAGTLTFPISNPGSGSSGQSGANGSTGNTNNSGASGASGGSSSAGGPDNGANGVGMGSGNNTTSGSQPVSNTSNGNPNPAPPTNTAPPSGPPNNSAPSASPVPEPNSLIFWALASMGIVGLTRKRSK